MGCAACIRTGIACGRRRQIARRTFLKELCHHWGHCRFVTAISDTWSFLIFISMTNIQWLSNVNALSQTAQHVKFNQPTARHFNNIVTMLKHYHNHIITNTLPSRKKTVIIFERKRRLPMARFGCVLLLVHGYG